MDEHNNDDPLDRSINRQRSTMMPTHTAHLRPIAYFTIAILLLATIALSIFAAVLLSKRTREEWNDNTIAAQKAYGKEFVRVVAQARRVLLRNNWIPKSVSETKALKYNPLIAS